MGKRKKMTKEIADQIQARWDELEEDGTGEYAALSIAAQEAGFESQDWYDFHASEPSEGA